MQELTPREIVEHLDRYIVGQNDAKRAVAIAIRNRWRQQQLTDEMKKEITPKNIIMIGPTGCGKTEIARRLASFIRAPFCKIEATKFTEVGYHGRDVESLVRDLVESAVRLVRSEEQEKVQSTAEQRAEERLLDLILPKSDDEDLPTETPEPIQMMIDAAGEEGGSSPFNQSYSEMSESSDDSESRYEKRRRTREKMRIKLANGELEDRMVKIRIKQRQSPVQFFNLGMENMEPDMQNLFDRIIPQDSKSREMSVKDARKAIIEEEIEKLIDRDAVGEKAIELAENSGIVFLDEIDKICGESSSQGPDVSRQGVQRDLLPIVEGTTVQTRYGSVHTENILFIAAGAFHFTKPADMMPELQGRFPIRVELNELGKDEFVRILKEPKNSITMQYVALLATEKINVKFEDEALMTIAEYAYDVNRSSNNIGARRLHTILEKLLEEVSFDAPDMKKKKLKIDKEYVDTKLKEIAEDEDLSKFIL